MHLRFLIGPQKEFCANPKHVLIDDADHNVDAFFNAGGNAVMIPRPWNRLRGLSIDDTLRTLRGFYKPLRPTKTETP